MTSHQQQQLFALRNNQGKPELSQVLHFDLAWLADHCAAGRDKYPDTAPGVPNWTLGGKPDAEYLDAAARHLQALVRGEEFDPELGTHHAAAVAWNMLAMLTNNRTYGTEDPVVAPDNGGLPREVRVGDRAMIYSLRPHGATDVLVSWWDQREAREDHVVYNRSLVDEFLDRGLWKVVE